MIDINMMSNKEKIIISVLLGAILILILVMFNPGNLNKNERKVVTEPQNILTAGGAPGAERGFFSSPKDIAVDKEGNIFVVDSKNNRIQKFNNVGVFVLAWGKEGNGPGELKEPCGIDIGPDGNIYVADTWNARVAIFTATGSFIRFVGQEQGLWGPRDVGVDKDGNVYILDTGNSVILKFDNKGKFVMTFGKKGGGKSETDYAEPFSMKQGPDGNLYVVDRKNFRIKVISTMGKYIREIKVKGWSTDQVAGGCLMEPYIAIDEQNNKILITDSTNHRVLTFNLNGGSVKSIALDKNKAKLNCPMGIAVLKNGQALVTDNSVGKIATILE